jgi:anti-sigma regulatory factor (Ser/Thr protein kinase)
MAEILSVQVDLPESAQVYAWVDEISERADLPKACRLALQIIAEEAVSNIIRHGFPDASPAAEDRINLMLDVDDAWVTLRIDDNGIPFDPRSTPTSQRAATLEDMRPGGLGIHLIRRRTASMDYVRREGRNWLTLRIARVPAKASPAAA